jgi:hypothetical protein
MTVLGGRKVDATGRATGRYKTNRHTRIAGQFGARLIEMLESPAHRVLSLSARRVLDRLEIEHAHHAGRDNGRLPVTFAQFQEYGIDRHAIAPAIRECTALGFLEVTERGRSGNGDFRKPNFFRLTFRPSASEQPTDDWRNIETLEQAEAAARAGRLWSRTKRQNASGGKRQPPWGKPTLSAAPTSGGNPHYSPGGETPTTSISREVSDAA